MLLHFHIVNFHIPKGEVIYGIALEVVNPSLSLS